jgi:hypothetical protein
MNADRDSPLGPRRLLQRAVQRTKARRAWQGRNANNGELEGATDCLNRITTPALRLNNLNEWLMRMRRNAWRHFLPFTTN